MSDVFILYSEVLVRVLMAGVLLVALATACGGGGGGNNAAPAPAMDAPTSLAATLYQAPGQFKLTWTRPSTAFDGYEFEGHQGTEAFAKLHTGLIPNTWLEAFYDAGSSVPELTSFTFRLRVMRGTTPSAYSNESAARVGLFTPAIGYPYSSAGGISIAWSNNSLVADTLLLERGTTLGSTTTWSSIPSVHFGSTTWFDQNATEGAACSYRVTYSKGQDSAQATSYSVSMPMVAPAQLTATPLVEGVRLTWQNPSQVATEVAIMRASGLDAYSSPQQVALVSTGTTSYTDNQLATGYYTYRLENRKTGLTPAQSAMVQVATLSPQNGASVTPTILTLPQAGVLRRSSLGAWFLSGPYRNGTVTVRVPSGSSWIDYTPPNAQLWADPYFLLDSQDRPHLVYSRSVVQGTQEVALMHAWQDATGWQNEEIARRTLYSSSALASCTFALDAQDRLHLLWLKNPGGLQDLEYAVKGADGAWIVEGLTGMTSAYSLGNYKLVLDPTGQPHVLVGAWQNLFHQVRSGGVWTMESIPANNASVGYYDFLGGVASGPAAITVFVNRAHQPYDGSYDLMMFRKEAGAWLPEETVLTTTGYSSFSGTLASNKTGTRFGLYYPTAGGSMLRVWTSGTWTTSLVGPSSYGTPLLGFDPLDKIFLLVPAGYGSSNSSYPYVLYQEQP